ncbi:MAG: glutamyl-tRNA reductase, partial [Deltaproteobacteria bacterium]
VGLNHRTAPVEVRERVAFKGEEIPKVLERFRGRHPENPVVLLSTCNRTELYTSNVPPEGVTEFLCQERGIPPAALKPNLYHFADREAVRHLFKVAASLDSLVIGEAEILGQVKAAYAQAAACGTTDRVLNAFFQRSLNVAKEVRSFTRIGQHKVSVSSVAVDLARQIFRSLEEKRVMVLGTGETGELTLRYLMSQGVERVILCNRTYAKAQVLARRYGGVAVPFELLGDYLLQADIVICSTSAQDYVLSYEMVKNIHQQRRNAILFLIDIAVPRDVDPRVNRLDNVYLYDIDDLEGIVEKNLGNREKEIAASLSIIDAEVEKFMGWLRTLDLGPLYKQLETQVAAIHERELERFRRKVPDLSAAQEEAVR